MGPSHVGRVSASSKLTLAIDIQERHMTAFTIELPDELATAARQAGLLNSQAVVSVMRELVRVRAAHTFTQAISAFSAQPANDSELTPADIQRAIHAARSH